MKKFFTFIFACRFILFLYVTVAKRHDVFFEFGEKYGQDLKVTRSIRATKKAHSHLHCFQFCKADKKCAGINYQGELQQCELFGPIGVKNTKTLAPSKHWSIFKLKEVLCSPNPCLNGGTCIILVDDYECQCPSDLIIGKHCEKDISFELEFLEDEDYAIAHMNFPKPAPAFTICFMFSGEPPKSDIPEGKTLFAMQRHKGTTDGCKDIIFSIRKSMFTYKVFSFSGQIKEMPTANVMSTCIAWNQTNLRIWIDGALKVDEKGTTHFDLKGSWFLTLCISRTNRTTTSCVINIDFNQKFNGKIGFFFIYDYFLSDAETLEYHMRRSWKPDRALVSWDRFRNPKYYEGDVDVIEMGDVD